MIARFTLLGWFLGASLGGITASGILAPVKLCAAEGIVAPTTLSTEASAGVADLLEYLPKITGREFVRRSPDETGSVRLARTDAADVPAGAVERLRGLSPEAFCLWPEGETQWIVAPADVGLAHGAVAYLERLGVRWYHVTDRWTIVPRRDIVRLEGPVVQSPAFRARGFSGSGGFGPATPHDPQRQMQQRWGAWQRRNRFGGEYQLSGHSGEAFNVKHRAELESHPEYRALVNGQRADWWLAGKFCISNPTVLELYVQDRLAVYRQMRTTAPDSPRSWAVSVEPADGGGHCECEKCLRLGSVSDRVFHVANVVARRVREEFPDGRVSLFAYNLHAAVPRIDLEPNVFVATIPYGFQRTDLSPEQLIDAWGRKVSELGIYDYWSIPDWTHDAPTFDPLRAGPERLRLWHRRGVRGFLNESTYSGGAMGLAWWIISRLAWEPEQNVETLFTTYCRENFGRGAPPIERMFRRWAEGYTPTSHELALSFRDVDEAWRLAESDAPSAARIADLSRYVEYLRLLERYDAQKRGTEESYRAAEELADYGWSIYDSAMVHAYRHAQLLGRDEAKLHPEFRDRFDPKNPDAPGWKASSRLTDDQIRSRVQAALATLVSQDYSAKKFTGPWSPRSTTLPELAEEERFGPILWPSNTQTIEWIIPPGRSGASMQLAIEQPVRMTIVDAAGERVSSEVLTGEQPGLQAWQTITFQVPRPGSYQMQLWSPKRTFCLRMPLDTPHALAGWYNSQGRPTPRLYFWVPADVERLAIYARYTAAGPPKFFDPDGVERVPTFVDDQRLILLDIPATQRGQPWSLDKAKCPIEHLRMLNVPGLFSFSVETLLIPAEQRPAN